MKVLLVIAEDHSLCEALRAALPEADLVLFEPTLDDAARRLVAMKADAIILDDGPSLGGEAIEPVKAIAPNTPLVILSSRGDVVTQAGLTRAGADSVIAKPFSFESLRETIDKLVNRQESPPRPFANGKAEVLRSAALNQHQMALRWISRASLYNDNIERLSQSLVESAADIFDAVRSAVLLEQDNAVRVVASQGIPESITSVLRLNYSSGLMRWFDEHACLIDRNTAEHAPDAVKHLHLLNARLATPLLRGGRVFGAILLGEKASGQNYSPEERELLTLVARCTSVAFERALVRADSALAQSRLDSVFANLQLGVVTIRPDKKISMINRQAEVILQLRSIELIGKSVQKLGSAFADVALRTLQDGQPRVGQQIKDPAIGGVLELNAAAMASEGVVVAFSVLPEEKVASEDIAYSPFWEYLSSRVAQEIKNPMVAINTFAQLLPRKYDSEDFRETFSIVMQKEVERINNVVETLFEFARNPKLSLQRSNLNETVQNVLRSFEDELGARSIELETVLDPMVNEADLDPIFFSQALHNVVQNSIDAMPEGGTLRVSTKKQPEQAEISIEDTGPGVPAHDKALIFMPFYSTKEKGMGLGLPLANRIVQQHHGDLQLVANGQSGGRFAIHLPTREKKNADNIGR